MSGEPTVKEIIIRYPDIEVDTESEFTEGVIRTINRSMTIKVPDGNYGSTTVGSSLTMDLKKNASVDMAIKQLDIKNAKSLKPHLDFLNAARGVK
jgi:hypothetical protein